MTTDCSTEYLVGLVRELCKLPQQTEWVEFKENIKEAVEAGAIAPYEATAAPKLMKYIPWWAAATGAGP
jgi:ATP-dependent DNA helicase RecG